MASDEKNIKDLVPILADIFIEYEPSINTSREYQAYFDSKKGKLGLLSNYMNRQMIDFEIISITQMDNNLDIEFNDTTYWFFKGVDFQEFDLNKITFPLHLIFKNVREYTVNEILENGRIVNNQEFNIIGAEILNDQLIYLDDSNIELGLALWKYSDNVSKHKLILVSAESFEIIEKQEQVFSELLKKGCL